MSFDFSKIKLVATDCDGVLTDGGMYYTQQGDVMKKFNVIDGVGFELLREAGIKTAILTAEKNPLLQKRAEKLRADYLYTGSKDKLGLLKNLCSELEITLSESAYIGDDLFDVPAIKACGFGCVPGSALEAVQKSADYITKRHGGEGAFREMVQLILQKRGKQMKKFILMAGPCVIESEDMVMDIAKELKQITAGKNVDFYFKASFDKANRTSIKSFRGPGIEEGLRILKKVKDTYELKIVTDIHEPWQAARVAEVADMLQIPAFLCRQTDLLVAAAKTGKLINVKKAQFLAPWDMKNVTEKIKEAGNENIMLCERGTSFGYNTLVVDMTSLVEMKKLHYPVIFDATHSVQKPGGQGGSTGGNREYVRYLARAAAATGIDGMFAEVHPEPDNALSDGPNMIPLSEFSDVLNEVLAVHNMIQDME